MRPPGSASTAEVAEVEAQKPEAFTSLKVDYAALFIIDFNLQLAELLPKVVCPLPQPASHVAYRRRSRSPDRDPQTAFDLFTLRSVPCGGSSPALRRYIAVTGRVGSDSNAPRLRSQHIPCLLSQGLSGSSDCGRPARRRPPDSRPAIRACGGCGRRS